MARPITKAQPELRLRDGVHYAYWYDPDTRRLCRRSLRTADRALAESALAAFRQPVQPVYTSAHRGDRKKGPSLSWRQWSLKMCKRARENAKAKRRPYEIDSDFVEQMLSSQEHRCAVTGIPFSDRSFYRNPFAPSLDQIRPGKGYLRSNVRIVAVIVNTAMNGWGEGPLYRLIYETRVLGQLASQKESADQLSD